MARGSTLQREKDIGGNCSYMADNGADVHTNAGTIEIAHLVPRHEVLVEPTDLVMHVGPMGGVTPIPGTTYTITPAAGGSNTITISAISGPNGPPLTAPVVFQSPAPGSYTVPPSGMTLDFSASSMGLGTCGAWDYSINVHDVANDYNNVLRHRFEIGLKEFALTPTDDWVVSDLAAPYPTRTYTVTNVRPTATTLTLTPGVTGGPAGLIMVSASTLTLGPAGSATDTATFTVGINPSLDASLVLGTTYAGHVTVEHQTATCTLQDPVVLKIPFTYGRQAFLSSSGPTLLPAPSGGATFGSRVRFDLDLSGEASSCVADLDLDLGISLSGVDASAPSMKIEVTSPGSAHGVLWDRNTVPGTEYSIWEAVSPYGTLHWLHLDDAVTPPLGPDLLSLFNTRQIRGHWYVDAYLSSSTLVAAGPARLTIRKAAFCFGGA